ncbi:MAG: hypothetical protein Q7K13_05930 [Polynucleobacter sp.]|uniref:STY0301 family protein n=1 Tax=Polynucleobacter sp. TaxID=2029855 RepID=UPI0027229232|nr:STY0301 family protein [Polynucleobacter sp.]MDO8714001.1 hypothetical protein [Polynucleobacter sp.]
MQNCFKTRPLEHHAFSPHLSVGASGICPDRKQDVVQQITIFDRDPADLASLAPDDDTKGVNTYTLKHIYKAGRIVTVRCSYGAGLVLDVTLKNPVNLCIFKRSKAGVPSILCR